MTRYFQVPRSKASFRAATRRNVTRPRVLRASSDLRDTLGNQMVSELLVKNIARKGYMLGDR